MPNINITRPELIWPGKYDENGNRVENRGVALPFQVIETIKEGRATREPGRVGDLFSFSKPKEDSEWRNKLIWGDNLLVMASLLEEFAGKIDLIYIDPPFATGADFSFKTTIGDAEIEVVKEPSLIEHKAYRDTWGKGNDSYLTMMYHRLLIMRGLLSKNGSIYVHCDWRFNSHLRVIMDEIFGSSNFRNEIYAKRKTKNLQNQFDEVTRLNIALDSVLWYSMDPDKRFRPAMKPAAEFNGDQWNNFYNNADRPTLRYPLLGINLTEGQWRWTRDKAEEAVANYVEYKEKHADKMSLFEYWVKTGKTQRFIKRDPGSTRCYYWVSPKDEIAADTNWADIYAYDNSPNSYATQKSVPFIERIIKASSSKGDLVADFFGGSGTSAAVAENLGRRWIGCDLGRFAIHTTRKRLLEIPDCKPFEILNLGKYERKYWLPIPLMLTPPFRSCRTPLLVIAKLAV